MFVFHRARSHWHGAELMGWLPALLSHLRELEAGCAGEDSAFRATEVPSDVGGVVTGFPAPDQFRVLEGPAPYLVRNSQGSKPFPTRSEGR